MAGFLASGRAVHSLLLRSTRGNPSAHSNTASGGLNLEQGKGITKGGDEHRRHVCASQGKFLKAEGKRRPPEEWLLVAVEGKISGHVAEIGRDPLFFLGARRSEHESRRSHVRRGCFLAGLAKPKD